MMKSRKKRPRPKSRRKVRSKARPARAGISPVPALPPPAPPAGPLIRTFTPQPPPPGLPTGIRGPGNRPPQPTASVLRPMGEVLSAVRAAAAGRKREVSALVLAAGMGKRMQSRDSKLVHPLAGRPMVRHVVDAARAADVARTVVVIGNQADEVRRAVGDGDKRIGFAYQQDQRGTGHAVLCAERQLAGQQGDLLILNGDLPALRPETLRAFVEFHRQSRAPLSILTTVVPDPRGYGRVIRNYGGDVSRIVEEGDATPEERATQEINCGIYCVDAANLWKPLRRARADNTQGEIYLTDLVEILKHDGQKIAAWRHPHPTEVLGVNDRRELAAAARVLHRRKAESLMRDGVTILDPETTYIDVDVRIGQDTVIEPGAMLIGETVIGREARIGAGCRIEGSVVGDGTTILPYCVISAARIGRACRVGPFAHLRPESLLDDEAHVGNFVETKKTRLGRGSKANHHAYLGDTEIGRNVNVGAGTITCNFDGVAKHRTIIEDEVFIGSDTQLVAPVRLRKGAFIGAGSTITRDVPSNALAVSRAPQVVKEDWVKRFGPAARNHRDGGSRKD